MKTVPVQIINTLEVEALPSVQREQIEKYFKSKNVNIRELTIKETSESLVNYLISYDSNQEILAILEKAKVELHKHKEGFKITKFVFDRPYQDELNKLLAVEKEKKVITYPIDYGNVVRSCYMKTYGAEGIEFINQDVINKQRSILSYLLKKIGTNLLSGKSIMNISLPIYIFDYRSLLESEAFHFRIAHKFLYSAADSDDKLERLKLVTAYVISTYQFNLTALKPFNPILGETFQTKVGECSVYYEQTSHHPPVCSYYVKHQKFICYGHKAIEASTGAQTITVEFNGKSFIQFNNGDLYQVKQGILTMTGVTMGRRYFNFKSLVVEDLTNNLVSVININPDERGTFSKLFTSRKTFPDYLTGFIANKSDLVIDNKTKLFKLASGANPLAVIEGEWSNYLNMDGTNYWRQGEDELLPMEAMNFTLASDSRYRDDILLLKQGQEEYAQEAKVCLEEIQRNDRKLREIYSKSHV